MPDIDINQRGVEEGFDLAVADLTNNSRQRLVGKEEFESMRDKGEIAFPPAVNFVAGAPLRSPDINNPAHGNLHGIGFEPPEEVQNKSDTRRRAVQVRVKKTK